MALKLYLDDCANSDLRADLLVQAGHAVTRPADVNLVGEDDDVHFKFAADHGLTVITKNPGDFFELHDTDSQHFGIFAVYQDNDPNRDMSDAEIVHAVANVEQAANSGGDPIERGYHILNQWRF